MGQISKRYEPWEWNNLGKARIYLIENCSVMFTGSKLHKARMVGPNLTVSPESHGEEITYRFEDFSVALSVEDQGHVGLIVYGEDHDIVRENFNRLNEILLSRE